MDNVRLSLITISYNNNEIGRLFVNRSGKLEFEGDAEESARILFDTHLKQFCEKHLDLLNEKIRYPLLFWKDNK